MELIAYPGLCLRTQHCKISAWEVGVSNQACFPLTKILSQPIWRSWFGESGGSARQQQQPRGPRGNRSEIVFAFLGSTIGDVDHSVLTVTTVVTEEEFLPFAEMLKKNTVLQSLQLSAGKRVRDED